jgi:hypothetical protein
MIPEELYKRRRNHNNTPPSMLLMLANFIVITVAVSLFSSCNKVHWFFWVVIGGLAVYNFFDIRRNREEYNKNIIISYIISLAVIVGVSIYWITTQNC